MLRWELGYHPRPFALGVFGAMVYAFATVGSSWVLGRVVDDVIRPRFDAGHVPTGTVLAGAAAIVGVGVLKAAGIVTRRVGASFAKFNVEQTMRTKVVEQYQRLPLAWHRSQSTGRLMATAERADLVLVLEHGRLVEAGTHAQLVRRGGVYAGLYRRWTSGIEADVLGAH